MTIKLTPGLADEITNLAFGCTGLALSVATGGTIFAVAGAAALGVIGLKRLAKNAKAAPDSEWQMNRIRKSLLRDRDWDNAQSFSNREALDNCQTALKEVLPLCSVSSEDLAEIARRPDIASFPDGAADEVMTAVIARDPVFADGIEYAFAKAVICEGFRIALEDDAYFRKLEKNLLLGTARDAARAADAAESADEKADRILEKLDSQSAMTPRSWKRAKAILDDMDLSNFTESEVISEVLNRAEAYEKALNLAEQKSNFGDGFDLLAKIVAEQLGKDDADAALAEIDRDLAAHDDEDARRDAERIRKLELGIQTAIAAGQAAKVAAFEIDRLGPPGDDWYGQVFGCRDQYHQEGLVHGVRLSLKIAAEICGQAAERAPKLTAWAALKNSEAISLMTLGERGDEAALSRSVAAYEAVLLVSTRDAAPMDWATTQNNLGIALQALGERGDNTALARSVVTYEAALEVRTRAAAPMKWAATQNNLGTALSTLGEHGDDASLARSVSVYESVLEVFTRVAAPRDWAMTQNNLGNSLKTLGERGDDAALARSVAAYEAALEVYTRDAAPMDWAKTRENMGLLYLFRAERGEREYLDKSIKAFEDALSVYSDDHHPYYFEEASRAFRLALALRGDTPSTP